MSLERESSVQIIVNTWKTIKEGISCHKNHVLSDHNLTVIT